MKLSKKDIYGAVQNALPKLRNSDSKLAVDSVFKYIEQAMLRGDEVEVLGFAKFSVQERKARQYYSPTTRMMIDGPATKYPKITPSNALKEKIKQQNKSS